MKKYKVLNADMRSPFQEFHYEIGKEYRCDDFDMNKENDCSRGFYATDIEGLPYSFNIRKKIYECEVGGKQVLIDQYKQRFETIRLIRECSFDEIEQLAKGKEESIGYKLSEALFPFNPFSIKTDLTDKHIQLVKEWDSVRDSVRASVWDSAWDPAWDPAWEPAWEPAWASVLASVWDSVWASVWDSVWDSVWASVWALVWDSVWDSVWASVWAYISSLFPNIEKWKYFEHEPGKNPFQPAVDMWMDGFVVVLKGKEAIIVNRNGVVKTITL